MERYSSFSLTRMITDTNGKKCFRLEIISHSNLHLISSLSSFHRSSLFLSSFHRSSLSSSFSLINFSHGRRFQFERRIKQTSGMEWKLEMKKWNHFVFFWCWKIFQAKRRKDRERERERIKTNPVKVICSNKKVYQKWYEITSLPNSLSPLTWIKNQTMTINRGFN